MQEEEILYDDIELSEVQDDITIEEVAQVIDVTDVTSFDIEVSEAFPASEDVDVRNHALLYNREISDAHPITAITGLREELDSIEALKTVYSDKKGNADYYEWADGHAIGENGIGCFVSLNKDARTISICTGDDIFGVVVDDAAFVGGQDSVVRDAHYGLVATSGAVHVRCELDVAEGDYVVSNSYGVATKASSDCGYKVVALHDINGVSHATIKLNISADQMNLMGGELQILDIRMDAAESNIISAVNVANQAYQKATNIGIVNQEMSNKVSGALDTVDKLGQEVTNMGNQVSKSETTSAQAKAIAEGAVVTAITAGNDALAQVKALTDEIEPITTWEDPTTGNVGASYLASYINNGLATKVEIETVENDLKYAESAMMQNAMSIRSLVAKIDKYSVGPRSQAYGFTLEQAKSILEIGMIYVPTENHPEVYKYTDGEYERSFIAGYLYQWDYISEETLGWLTVGESPSVWFSAIEPIISDVWEYGYWYTNGDEITDKYGNTGTYETYTLYKWEKPDWFAVATLKGNANNRAIATIEQSVTDNAASIGMVVENNAVKGGVIVRAINDQSEVQITADKLYFAGEQLDIHVNAANINGNLEVGGLLDVNIDDKTVSIGGFTVADSSLHSTDKLAFNDENKGVYLGTDGIGLGNGKFYVTSAGEMVATSGYFGDLGIKEGFISSGNEGGVIIQGGEITADTITLRDQLKISGIGGQLEGSAALYFEEKNNNMHTIVFTATMLDKDSHPISGVYPKLLVTASDKVPYSVDIHVFIDFLNQGSSYTECDVIIPEGSTSVTYEFTNMYFGNTDLAFALTPSSITYEETETIGAVGCDGTFLPYEDNVYHLGLSTNRWNDIWASNGTINTSDRNEKNTITPLTDVHGRIFDQLVPVTFKFNKNTSDRLHLGLVAQDVKEALDNTGVDSKNFAAYCEWENKDGSVGCGLRYTEFIALCIDQIQRLKKRVEELEDKMNNSTK